MEFAPTVELHVGVGLGSVERLLKTVVKSAELRLKASNKGSPEISIS